MQSNKLGIAGLIGLGEHLGAWGGALFLFAIALSFWVIYTLKREFWWAVIPAGTLTTLAVVAAVAEPAGELAGGLFFLGLAATFGLVYLLPTPQGRMKWAWIPALVLALTSSAFNYRSYAVRWSSRPGRAVSRPGTAFWMPKRWSRYGFQPTRPTFGPVSA